MTPIRRDQKRKRKQVDLAEKVSDDDLNAGRNDALRQHKRTAHHPTPKEGEGDEGSCETRPNPVSPWRNWLTC
ncbi:hypothetical protein CEXT_17171 [Caerostris extrusa]|uniref:Uncharacterized protein n=1 Tax=Caerostris extrusa TaxID=172846 RepID=A0AAV4S1W4_CAEEX|nr:hypothetical protein CEXT_17171 [Caerostris extrusa]